MARNIVSKDFEAREIAAEIAALDGQYAGKRFPEDERARWNELNERLEEIETRNDRIRELHAAGSVESTTDSYQHPVRRSGPGNRDAALWTIDRHRRKLNAESGDRLEQLVRFNDPTGIAGRYLRATADPTYLSAFGKLLAGPQTAHLRMTREEQDAVLRVSGEAAPAPAPRPCRTRVRIPYAPPDKNPCQRGGFVLRRRSSCKLRTTPRRLTRSRRSSHRRTPLP